MKKCKYIFLSLQALSIVTLYLMTCRYPLTKSALGPRTGGNKGTSVPWRDKESSEPGFLLSHSKKLNLSWTNTPDSPTFQRVNQYDAWVFSSFFDTHKGKNLTRTFAIQDFSIEAPVLCHVTEAESVVVVNGTRTFVRDTFTNRFWVVSYECEIRSMDRPLSVSFTFNKSDSPTNSMRVFYSPPMKRNFTVCHAALFDFHDFMQVVQSFEFDRVLGAEHFYVYNSSVSGSTDAVLRHYQGLGLLTVIQWRVPVSDTHYHAQLLAINDCVYRNRDVSRFVVIKDTDELIVPHRHGSWAELISSADSDFLAEASGSRDGSRPSTYVFESTFFQRTPDASEWSSIKRDYSISEQDEALFEKYSLTSLTHLGRMSTTFGRKRTKAIVRPELVLLAHVHHTYRQRSAACSVYVDPDVALVHHHRRFKYASVDYQTELSALRFKDKVLWGINETMFHLHL